MLTVMKQGEVPSNYEAQIQQSPREWNLCTDPCRPHCSVARVGLYEEVALSLQKQGVEADWWFWCLSGRTWHSETIGVILRGWYDLLVLFF
jgi:hypothetical protein